MKNINRFNRYKCTFIDSAILISLFAFLLSYFHPSLILSQNIPTGGDMASHYYPAQYLKEVLLRKGRIVGWLQGNYAGFPLFQVYFPCPFLFIVLLSYVIPMQIAFKIVAILGIFSLPFCVYTSLRFTNYKFPIPILGALFALPFLFMEANSMWGGNIPSTLAGEFPFGIGLSLSILFLGLLYQGIENRRGVISNGILLFFVGFNHAYTLIFSVLTSMFFLVTLVDFVYKFKYLLKVYLIAFLLISFWAIPLVINVTYTTNFNIVWKIDSFFEVMPVILIPFAGISITGSVVHGYLRITKREPTDLRLWYLWFGIFISMIFYFSANKIGVVDIRFLPFMQILLMVIAAAVFSRGIQYLKLPWMIPIIVTPLIFLWVSKEVTYIPQWIAWNFTGFESKEFWPQFDKINQYLKGTENDPRVVYEHAPEHNAIGTTRAFESIPLFSGRSTLEGLYMQSTITSPFVFYIQSEISKVASAPLPDYTYTSLNLKEGIKHLKMFNVKDFIVISDVVKSAIRQLPEFQLKASFSPYEIYELTTNDNHYVTPVPYEPVLCITNNWKKLFFDWFKDSSVNGVHLVLYNKKTCSRKAIDSLPFRYIIKDNNLKNIPKIPLDTTGAYVKELVKDDEVIIETNWINKPLLVKISYHKNWKVEGAREIYQVSPSFMLIYPQSKYVRLYFGYGISDYLGRGLTILGIIIIGISLYSREIWYRLPFINDIIKGFKTAETRFFETRFFQTLLKNRKKILTGVVSLLLIFFLFTVFLQKKDPQKLYNDGLKYFDQKKYARAKQKFSTILKDFPYVSAAADANYYYAICFFKENDYQKTMDIFQSLIERYKDSNWVPESYYHIGLCKARIGDISGAHATYSYLITNYSVTVWANYAKERLNELNTNAQ